MSSSRFPGKMLAPMLGVPLIRRVLERVAGGVEGGTAGGRVVLVTSTAASDDPLALYVERELGFAVYRGELENVFARFQACVRGLGCDWFVRISGDSPVLDGRLLAWMLALPRDDVDLVTNVHLRTFPPGQSVEILRAAPFLAMDAAALSDEDRFHVTLPYYREGAPYRLRKVESRRPEQAAVRMVVDSVEDLKRLEASLEREPQALAGFAELAQVRA